MCGKNPFTKNSSSKNAKEPGLLNGMIKNRRWNFFTDCRKIMESITRISIYEKRPDPIPVN
ncbi:hypothetical protein LEP1GSC043_1820 [Leptospira weilii str. Ecochallenge]|uniref:Uncharacterized protein n=1 Tax=Leptospira weilii str. Ecochallenge TaxID=1049986 RepID=N1U9F1_9LEPT|nr:hypothetical protein LEP1GSC043_1820 [Leptospira weilii str. Ecochallenge]